MVKLTTKYLFRKISKKNNLEPRKKEETDFDYLNKMTHLHLQSQFIDKIASIPECQSIIVIYLHNNLIQTIENLESFPNLTHLQLQHNYISKIENLEKLKSLRKLYLGHNEIAVVEGLEELEKLQELHLESQRLPQGETLYFDPRTLSCLGRTLKVLNISNNNITSIRGLGELFSLSKLTVEDNQIKDIDDVAETISLLPNLETFNSEGNPVAANRKYLDAIVLASKSLKTLNGKTIDEQTRIFIMNLAHNRKRRKNLSKFSTRVLDSRESFMGSRDVCLTGQVHSDSLPRVGSKLFPVLKKLSERGTKLMPSLVSSKGMPLDKSVKVTQVPSSASCYL